MTCEIFPRFDPPQTEESALAEAPETAAQAQAAQAPLALLDAIRRLLRPLVRLAIEHGITFPVIAELLRGLFVEVAARDVLRDAGARTDSRLSLLTGVHRKEIRRLRLAPETVTAVPEIVTVSSQIVARWLGAPGYTDAAGQPRVLPRTGPAPSFEALVGAVTTDVRPRAVLDDFIGQGLATLEEDRVRLNRAAFIPRPGRAEQMFFFGRNLHDHIAAASANVSAIGTAPFLDSSVHYDRLDAAAAGGLAALAQREAGQALLAVNRAALAMLTRADENGSEGGSGTPRAGTARVNFGVYVFVEDEKPEAGA